MHKKISWNKDLAYAVGLITTDGCLSKDGRHIDLTSKDINLIKDFASILEISNKITNKISAYKPTGIYYRIQLSHANFYRFLVDLGLSPNKSRSLGPLRIPSEYFADFLRGCIDGDGNISIVKHPESQHPQLRLRLASSSSNFLQWIKQSVNQYWEISGGFISKIYKNTQYLTYSKSDSIKILELLYYNGVKYYLKRKFNYYHNSMAKWRNWHTRTV